MYENLGVFATTTATLTKTSLPSLVQGGQSYIWRRQRVNNKHLMTGPKGNSEFCFPETSMFPEAKPKGTLRLEGKQNSLFPKGPVIKCFVIPPNSKYRV